MGLRLFINDANGHISAAPLGGAIAETSSPIDIYKLNVEVEWQFGASDLNGIYRPLRKPDMTTFAMDFLPKAQFSDGGLGATFGLDPASVVRPVAGTGTGYFVNQSAGYAIGYRLITLDTGSGSILAGDYVYIQNYLYQVEVGISSPGTITIASPGLQELVLDNAQVILDKEAGFYTGMLLGDTVNGRALLGTTGDALPMNGQMTWLEPGDDPAGPPRSTQRIYATYLNTFDFTGVGPSVVTPGWAFLTTVTGITGGGVTNLDGLPTVGRGYNVIEFVDATAGIVSYQLRAGTDATAAPAIVRAADYASGYHFVWYSV